MKRRIIQDVVVEFHQAAAGGERPCPVDYKRGKRRKWDNDDIQLCAQALCLEEMLGVEVPSGAIFHAASRRRREVIFNAPLRGDTLRAVQRLHRLVTEGRVPTASWMPKCEGCSLKPNCIPELFDRRDELSRAAHHLFVPDWETGT